MRIKHKVNVRITEDAEGKDCLFGPDDTKAEVVIDSYARQASGLLSIDAGATESLSFGDVTAVKGLYLKLSEEAQVQFNAGGGLIQLRKGSTASGTYAKLFLEADLTQVDITAPVGAAVTGTWCVWGDAVV